MKIILILFAILFSNSGLAQDQNNYKIKQIKQDHNWYIIIATRHDSVFKIVSQKVELPTSNAEKIKVGNYYNLQLKSIIPIINGVKMWPANYLDFAGISLDDKTIVNINPEKGIYDLYSASNLIGLYILRQ